MAQVGIRELLEAGVHFGHQTRRWNPKMRRFIHGENGGIYIIDLLKTEALLEQAQRFAGDVAHRGGTVLFVGTKKQARDSVKEIAEAAGQPYVNHRWLGGLLTNFQTISLRIKRLHDLERYESEGQLQLLPTRERMAAQADLEKLQANLGGVKHMQRPPDAMFVVDLKTEVIAVREAQRLRIPIIGLVDTNCDPDGIDYVIPGNDDAIRACALITKAIGDVVSEGRQVFRAEEEKARQEAEEQARREQEEKARREQEEKERAEAEARERAEAEAALAQRRHRRAARRRRGAGADAARGARSGRRGRPTPRPPRRPPPSRRGRRARGRRRPGDRRDAAAEAPPPRPPEAESPPRRPSPRRGAPSRAEERQARRGGRAAEAAPSRAEAPEAARRPSRRRGGAEPAEAEGEDKSLVDRAQEPPTRPSTRPRARRRPPPTRPRAPRRPSPTRPGPLGAVAEAAASAAGAVGDAVHDEDKKKKKTTKKKKDEDSK